MIRYGAPPSSPSTPQEEGEWIGGRMRAALSPLPPLGQDVSNPLDGFALRVGPKVSHTASPLLVSRMTSHPGSVGLSSGPLPKGFLSLPLVSGPSPFN